MLTGNLGECYGATTKIAREFPSQKKVMGKYCHKPVTVFSSHQAAIIQQGGTRSRWT
jgi:hypothetical protein